MEGFMAEQDLKNNGGTKETIEKTSMKVLSSEKREDIWAIIIAAIILILCSISPDTVHTFFKKSLFLF